tara:strand:+ start:15270 stop:15632 length:363 start_codon:yes stop_codon:yes gene_type:complete
MRKITQRIKSAFESGRELRVDNTYTDGESVWLFGNKIIKRENGEVFATLAGWNTPTTRERVNGITGIGFHQEHFLPKVNGRPVDSREWINVGKERARAYLAGKIKGDFPEMEDRVEVVVV